MYEDVAKNNVIRQSTRAGDDTIRRCRELLAGDLPGYPFRGNQYEDGQGGSDSPAGSGGGSTDESFKERIDRETQKMEQEAKRTEAEFKTLSKSLGLPGGAAAHVTGVSYSWRKQSGYGGQKTLNTVARTAIANGFTRINSGDPDYAVYKKDDWHLTLSSRYGSRSSENVFTIHFRRGSW